MTSKRQVFYSFHYEEDKWRASQVRNIGVVEGNRPATDNDWEEIKHGGDNAIKQWIKEQMQYRSCTVVLVGSCTANRKWINYEIAESWNNGKGVVGIHVHGLKNQDGDTSQKGDNPFHLHGLENQDGDTSRKGVNPFHYLSLPGGQRLSSIVKCYDPIGTSSVEIYNWIKENLPRAIEEAITIRQKK